MSLHNIKKMRSERGFTIVELLIVIVVIGILAAIVIVAYTGIQDRARNTQYQTDATALLKGAEAVNADLGAYPSGATTAALKTSFNSSTTFKLPSGVDIAYVAVGTLPTNAAVLTLSTGVTPRVYDVTPCTSGGIKIYYGVKGGAIQTLTGGDVTTC